MKKSRKAKQPQDWKASHGIENLKQRLFLTALSVTGIVSEASRLSKIPRSSHYSWLAEQGPDEKPTHAALRYKDAIADATDQASDALELEIWNRAMNGYREPVYQGGKCVGHKVRKSDTLLMFLANGPMGRGKFKYHQVHEHTGPEGKPLPAPEVHTHLSIDLSNLTGEELELYRKIAARGAAAAEAGADLGGSGNGQADV